MKLLKAVLPNLTVSLNLALMIVIYLDMRNPMMGFLIGTPFVVLVASCCVCSILTAVTLYASWRRMKQKLAKENEVKQ